MQATVPGLASVVVLNHNGAGILDVLRRSVLAIKGQNYGRCELILADDNSTDGSDSTVAGMCRELGGLFVSTREGRHGISAARNLALRRSHGEYIAFLDNDAVPQGGWLTALVRRMDSDSSVGACASRVVFADKPDVVNSMGSVLNELFHGNGVRIHELNDYAHVPAEVMYATGNGMMLRCQAVEQVGEFDEGYLYWGADDADYGMRLRRMGWRIVPVADAVVHHLHSYSKTQQGMPFWDGRNRVRMALKHSSWQELLRFVVQDAPHFGSPALARHYARCWWSALSDWPGLKGLLIYRWAHRGQTGYRRAFAPYFRPESRLLVAPDNRGFGRDMAPLTSLQVSVNDEPHLYHGWYWVEHWANTPMRWAMQIASLVGSAPTGARSLRWRVLPPRGSGPACLTVRVQRREMSGYVDVTRLPLKIPAGFAAQPVECVTPCEILPGEYRFVLEAQQSIVESGYFPRQIGFGLAGLELEPGGTGGRQ